jgi:GTP-binding protein Era
MGFKSGFVAIVGRPNVGKSTFMNYVLGEKVTIISPKPQTTRNRIQGIYTTPNEQVIFIDTPGIHKPKHELGQFMNNQALTTLKEVDLILLLVDGTESFGTGDQFVAKLLQDITVPCYLVINKTDIIKNKERLYETVKNFTDLKTFKEVFYIAAINGDNVSNLLTSIIGTLEEGPQYFPTDQITDHPEVFIISEIIREKVLILTRQEVPHSVAVIIDEMKEDEKGLMNIHATIFVERSSQKKIIIGKNGALIKEIGTQARKEIVMLLGQKIFLELWIKVEDDWRTKKSHLRKMGYYIEK